MKEQLKHNIQTGLGSIRDLILPPTCLACDTVVHQRGGVCSDCWTDIRFIEKPYCDVLGAPFSYDLGQGALSAQAIAHPPAYDRSRSCVLYDDVARRLVQGLKFSDRTELAPWMAQWMERAGQDFWGQALTVVPVPLHRTRLFSRRFNQSAELARHLARLKNLTYDPGMLIRVKATKQQVGLGLKERRKNVSGAFRVAPEKAPNVKDASILLVDDVFTTGATLEACARALRRKGASQIFCLTFARVANGVAVNDL